MEIGVKFYRSAIHEDVIALWREGMEYHMEIGAYAGDRITNPNPSHCAWVSYVDGAPASIQVSSIVGEDAVGVLTYVRPQFRGMRLHSHVQAAMNVDLPPLSVTHTISTVTPDTPLSYRLAASVLDGGAVIVGEDTVVLPRGETRRIKYRRPLVRD